MSYSSESRSHRGRGIQCKLALLLVFIVMPVLLIEAFIYYDRFQTMRAHELQANIEIARAVSKTFDAFVQDVIHQEHAIGLAISSLDPKGPEEITRLLDTHRDYAAVRDFSWVSPRGVFLYSSNPAMVGADNSDRAYFLNIANGREWTVGELVLARTTGKPVFGISRGIRDEKNILLGVVVATITPERLDSVLSVERGKGGGVALVDHKGMLVYRYPAIDVSWENRNWLRDYPEFEEVLKGKETATTVYAPYEGKNRLVGFTPVSSIGWAATAGITEEIAMGEAISALKFHAALLLAVIAAAVGASLLFSRKVAASIKGIRDHALALGRGETASSMVVSGTSELKDLADAFNAMAETIRSREKALRDSEERLHVTLTSIGDAVIATDTAARVTFINPVASALTGWELEEALGQQIESVLQIVDERTNEPGEELVLRVLRDGCTIAMANHTALVTRDGRMIPIEDSAAPIKDSTGNVVGVVIVFHDVAEKRRARESMNQLNRELERRLSELQTIFDTAPFGLAIAEDPQGLRIRGNRTNERILGVPPQGELSKRAPQPVPFRIFLDGRELAVDELPMQRAIRGETVSGQIIDLVRKDGQEVALYCNAAPLFDEEGQPRGAVGAFMDFTEIKRVERALRESETRFKLLSEAAGSLLTTQEPQRIVDELCRKIMEHLDCHAFFNFLTEESAGKLRLNAYAGIPDEEARKIEWLDFGVAVCGCVAREGKRMIAEDIFHASDIRTELVKSYGIQAYACHPLMSQGKIIGTLSFGTKTRPRFSPEDIALMNTVADQVATAMERVRLIKELRESRDKLELRVQERTAEIETYMKKLQESNQALQDFASIASHDLQEPLRKVISFGNRLKQKYGGSIGPDGQDYLHRMLNATERMQSLLKSLLEYSRVTTKAEPFREVGLSAIIREVLSDLEVRIEKTGGEVLVEDLPVIQADPTQMGQLFQNLIGNALKFHKQGEKPVVKVHCVASGSGYCKIMVEDNGIGFEEQYLDVIFAPFQRLHGRSSQYEGTGMGLAICKKIVERHGGSITAKSAPGGGTVFIIELPIG